MRNRMVLLAASAATAVLGTVGCSAPSDHRSTANAKHDNAGQSREAVQISSSGLGQILTDQNGRTLYAFTHDKDGTSNCTGQCVATWPALAGKQAPIPGPGIDKSLLSQTAATEGAVQAMYNNWPLYYYVGDIGPGDIDGQGVDDVWFVVRPDGTLTRTLP